MKWNEIITNDNWKYFLFRRRLLKHEKSLSSWWCSSIPLALSRTLGYHNVLPSPMQFFQTVMTTMKKKIKKIVSYEVFFIFIWRSFSHYLFSCHRLPIPTVSQPTWNSLELMPTWEESHHSIHRRRRRWWWRRRSTGRRTRKTIRG